MEAHFSRLPGGQYPARQHEDGTWDVYGVPVFSTVKKGEKRAPRDITREDLLSAVKSHQQQFREDKFLARTNVLHNYGVQKAMPAGFFLPHSVRSLRFRGETRPVIFADLIAVPDDVFRQIDSDGLPYCSVEVRSYEPLTFGALALLDTEPPYFEFPLITTGMKQYAEVSEAVTVPDVPGFEAPVAIASFRFAEDAMPEDMPDKKKDDESEAEMQADGGASESLEQAASGLEAIMEPLMAIKAMLEKLTGAGAEAEEEPDGDGPVDEPVAAMKAHTEKEVAKLEGRIAGLEQFRAKRESEDKQNALFSEAVEKLEADGYALTDSIRSRLRKLAGKDEDVFHAFVESYRETAIQDPPDDWPGASFSSVDAGLPEEVMSYKSKGPEVFSAAQKAFREWRELPDDQYRSPLGGYLKREVG